jgi:cytidyltransferase-like protein
MNARVGLVVGKFCPLHLGHQRLIDFAAARCERLVLISYTNPEFPGCAPAERARWLAALYPAATRLVVDDAALAAFAARTGEAPRTVPPNDAPDDVHRAFTGWLCLAMLGTTVDAVFTSEAYGAGFAAYLSAWFERATGRACPVEHTLFDQARTLVPVSGTALRQNPQAHRAFLPEVVAASFLGERANARP